jgi:O-acetyl-ADP-ribose deacetylase (regulator of RNase III)
MPSQIEVVQGDITDQEVDAIVNAANNNLWMGTGVAGAIVRHGGAGIEAEAIAQGPIQIGAAVITGGGTLPANHVIHAAAMGQDLATDGQKIHDATISALELAEANNLESIAFPAIGTGVGRFPANECARIMIAAARERATAENAVPLVRFVLFDEPGYQAFRDAAH